MNLVQSSNSLEYTPTVLFTSQPSVNRASQQIDHEYQHTFYTQVLHNITILVSLTSSYYFLTGIGMGQQHKTSNFIAMIIAIKQTRDQLSTAYIVQMIVPVYCPPKGKQRKKLFARVSACRVYMLQWSGNQNLSIVLVEYYVHVQNTKDYS